jgi:hypothetical protein
VPAECVHLSIAARVAEVLALPPASRPAFVLGSVAVDVNNPLGWAREETHFWYGPDGDNVSGVATLLGRYPELAASHLTPPERAFVAGYLSHLLTDEQELAVLYRPYVVPLLDERPTPDRRELRLASLVLVDGAVEADGPHWLRAGGDGLRAALGVRLRDDLLPFVGLAAVRAWAAQTLAVTDLPASRPRVEPHRANKEPPRETMERVARLQEVLRQAVPPAVIRDFIQRATGESVRFIRAYQAGDPLPTPQGTTPAHEPALR